MNILRYQINKVQLQQEADSMPDTQTHHSETEMAKNVTKYTVIIALNVT